MEVRVSLYICPSGNVLLITLNHLRVMNLFTTQVLFIIAILKDSILTISVWIPQSFGFMKTMIK